MRTLKYLLKDIRNNKWICAIFCILNIVMLLLVCVLFDVIDDTKESMGAVKTFESGYGNAYMISDETSEEEFAEIVSDTDSASQAYKQLFAELSNSNISYYTVFGYDMYVNEEKNTVREQIVTEQFFDVFQISVMKGRKFEAADFDTVDVRPIIVGYELQNEYKLGEEYEFVHGGTGEVLKGKVIGVLEKNAKYYELNGYSASMSLDFSYLVPQNTKNMDNLSFSDLDMATTRMVVFGDKNEIQKIFSNTSPIHTSLVNVNDWVDEVIQNQKASLLQVGSISLVFFTFTLAITYVGFARLFKKQMKEYRIHMFCGARKSHIIMRFLALSGLMLGIGVIVASGLYGNLEYTGKMVIFSIVFSVITSIYPYVVLKREVR